MSQRLFTDSELKYVVAEVKNKKDEQVKILITGYCPLNRNKYYHAEIAYGFARKNGISIIEIHGGGRIHVNKEKKVIKFFDRSGKYGFAHYEDVKPLATEAMQREGFSDYSLVIDDVV